MNAQVDETLMKALYGAAVQEGDWKPALDRVCTLLRSSEAAMTLLRSSEAAMAVGTGPDFATVESTGRVLTAEVTGRYAEHYGRLDPKLKIFARNTPGYLFNDARHFDEAFVAHDVFYQEFSRSLGTRHTLDLLAERDGDREVFFAVMRPRRAGPYQPQSEILFRQASGHFVRALALKEKMDSLHRAGDALDSLDFGIIIVDAFRRVVFLNRASEAHLGSASEVRLSQGTLMARSPSVDRKLESLVDLAVARNCQAGVLRVTDERGKSAVLRVTPLPENSRLHAHVPRAALVIICGRVKARLGSADLVALYGLTERESRIALAVAEGATLAAIATRNGVKYSTVRTQLLSVMEKMGVHRQMDVARVLNSGAQADWDDPLPAGR